MAWIESHQEVGRHPKTRKLARLLGVSLPAAVGYLHYLWWWALDFAQDGMIEKFDADDIADALQWDGDADQLVEALISSGYIDRTEDGLAVHDWYDYAGKLLERRAKDRARKSAARDGATSPKGVQRKSKGKGEEGHPDETQALQERRFAEFWENYPKKVGKASCLKAWLKLRPTTELHEHIMAALTKQRASEQWQREGGRYIPNPLTWLNQGRWDDEPIEASGTAAPVSTGTGGMLDKLRAMYEAEGGDDE